MDKRRNKRKFASKIINYYTTSDASAGVSLNSDITASSFALKLRTKTSALCDKSQTANFLKYIYYAFLNCQLSAVSVFLAVFSVISLSVRFVITGSKIDFFLNTSNWIPVILLLVALMIIPIKKDIASLLSTSRFLGLFEFSYDKKILKASVKEFNFYSGFSTSFFLGVLAAIASVLFSPLRILLFIALIILSILIINRPECGALLTVFATPLLGSECTLFLTIFSSFSLLYKYLAAKRHISLGRDEFLLLICSIIFVTSGVATASGLPGLHEVGCLLAAVLAYICIKNLICSVSLFNNCIRLITFSTLIVSFIIISVHIIKLTMDTVFINSLCEINYMKYIFIFFNDNLTLNIILAAALPLNISLILGHNKNRRRIKHITSALLQFACVILSGNASLLTASIFSTIIVLMFYKKKFLVLLPFTPMFTEALIRIPKLIPYNLGISFTGNSYSTAMGVAVTDAIKSNLLFGIGLGGDNFASCITSYALPSAGNYAHPPSTALSFVLSFGLPAALFITVVILCILSNNLKSALSSRNINKSIDASTAGLFGTAICLVVSSACMYVTGDSVIPVFFATICALGCCSKKCIYSDYVDNDNMRIHLGN